MAEIGTFKRALLIICTYFLEADIQLSNFQVPIQIQNTPLFFSGYPQVLNPYFALLAEFLV